jgi:gluconolactonase
MRIARTRHFLSCVSRQSGEGNMADNKGTVEVHESDFENLISKDAEGEILGSGYEWAEGPCWFNDGQFLIWSDIPNNRILQWAEGLGVRDFRNPSGFTNGHFRDHQGRLVSCSHGNRRVERTEPDGSITVIADAYEGKRLNSPNDVVVKSDGTIWFTDPPYGILSNREGYKSEQEQDGCYVYCFDPQSAALKIVVDDFGKPNGLCFSPDESLMYISDSAYSHDKSAPHHIRVFDVQAGNTLSGGDVFVEVNPGLPDGFRCDEHGNVWTSAGDGVHCYTPSGVLLGKIITGEVTANVTFGGPDRNRLFIAANHELVVIDTKAKGIQRP